MTTTNAPEFNRRLTAVVHEIRQLELDAEGLVREAADADREFRAGEARALTLITEYRNVDDRRVQAELLKDGHLGDLRYKAHIAQGRVDIAKRAHASRMAELSALQSLSAQEREEMRFARTEPGESRTA